MKYVAHVPAAWSFVTLLLAVTFEGRCRFEECATARGSDYLHKALKAVFPERMSGKLLHFLFTESIQRTAVRSRCCLSFTCIILKKKKVLKNILINSD